MSFASFGEFLAMGGHGVYVWTAYAIGLAVLLGNALAPIFAKKRFWREFAQDKARRERREHSRAGVSP